MERQVSGKLCLHRLVQGGPQCVLNKHPDKPDSHAYTVDVRRWLLDEAIRRASALRWRSISMSRLHRLSMGDVKALPKEKA